MTRINILWTGGLDSTYSVAVFSRLPVEIQPIYLNDDRDSEEYELRAVREITEILESRPETRAVFLPLITKPTRLIAKDREITAAYKRLRKTDHIGSQYDWLARYARETGMDDLYVSIEKSAHSRARACVYKYGDTKLIHDEAGFDYFVADREKTAADVLTVFGNIRLPMSWDRTKDEEAKELRDMGLEDVLDKTWFCYTPVDNKPCGTCNPCKQAIEDGMTWRFSPEALKRYEEDKKVPAWKHQLRDYKNLLISKLSGRR